MRRVSGGGASSRTPASGREEASDRTVTLSPPLLAHLLGYDHRCPLGALLNQRLRVVPYEQPEDVHLKAAPGRQVQGQPAGGAPHLKDVLARLVRVPRSLRPALAKRELLDNDDKGEKRDKHPAIA